MVVFLCIVDWDGIGSGSSEVLLMFYSPLLHQGCIKRQKRRHSVLTSCISFFDDWQIVPSTCSDVTSYTIRLPYTMTGVRSQRKNDMRRHHPTSPVLHTITNSAWVGHGSDGTLQPPGSTPSPPFMYSDFTLRSRRSLCASGIHETRCE